MTGALAFVVPAGVDDPARVSGGNVYDGRVRDGLRARGWEVGMREVADPAAAAAALAALPDYGTAIVDGLVAEWAPQAVAAAARRARVVLLAHMLPTAPLLVHEVVATSGWTAGELARRGLAPGARRHVAAPGTDPAPRSVGSPREDRLLCVGVLAPHKGQDLLLDALERLGELSWAATLAGSDAADPGYAGELAARARRLGARARLAGVLHGAELERAYHRADLLVAPSRAESAGMAIAEARRRGLPVVAAAVGGIPDTVAGGGAVLVAPDDPTALAAALRAWLTDAALRNRLRAEAARAAAVMPGWDVTVDAIAAVLSGDAAEAAA